MVSLKVLQSLQENTFLRESVFNKVDVWRPATLLERDSSTVVSAFSEFLWSFQESFFVEHLLVATSDITLCFSFLQINVVKNNLFGGAMLR